jgi:phosphatidylserine/phosphatidylglycerophosphate/cardiolipin synthase-like enzyme
MSNHPVDKEIDVRCFLDERNKDKEMPDLKHLRYDKSSSYSHNKFCIIDKKVVFTGSYNPTVNGNEKNNNAVAVIYSRNLARIYSDEFDELYQANPDSRSVFNRILLNSSLFEAYFCPEECKASDAVQRLLQLIRSANDSIRIAAFAFTHDALAQELIRAANSGIDVRIVMESLLANTRGSEYKRFIVSGICAEKDQNSAMMHHKFMVIDKKIVVFGSTNFSANGFGRNDENILIIHDAGIAKRFSEEFESVADRCRSTA